MGGPNCVYKNIDRREDQISLHSSPISGPVINSTSAKSSKSPTPRQKAKSAKRSRSPSISGAPHRRAMLEAAARSSNQRDQSRHHRKRAHCGVISSAQPATCFAGVAANEIGALSAAPKLQQHSQGVACEPEISLKPVCRCESCSQRHAAICVSLLLVL